MDGYLQVETRRWCCVWRCTRFAGDDRRFWKWRARGCWRKPEMSRGCGAGMKLAGCDSRPPSTDWKRPSSGWDWLAGRSSGRRSTRKCAGISCWGRSRAGNCTTRSPKPGNWRCCPRRAECTAREASARERSVSNRPHFNNCYTRLAAELSIALQLLLPTLSSICNISG